MNIRYVNLNQEHSDLTGIKKEASEKKDKKQIENGTIYAGNMNFSKQDILAEKKTQEQKKALKGIVDQYNNDLKTTDQINTLNETQSKMDTIAKEGQSEIRRLQDLKKDLQESSGITEDSEEQKDLELLEKSMNPNQTLSEDEMKQLKSMGPLTDYQKTALSYDAMQQVFQQNVDAALNQKESAGKSIDAIKLEEVKTHPMVDAQKEAAEIMEDASKEAVSMLMNDVKDKVDDTIEKSKKKAEDAEEKKNKEEEQKAEAKKDDVSQQVQQDNNDGAVNSSTDVQNSAQVQTASDGDKMIEELKAVIKKESMIEEDTKGILLDEQL